MDGKSQRLQLHSYRQSEDVFQRHAAILELGADIEVAGTDFVEQGDALGILAAVAGYLPCDALAEGNIQAKLGGHELIVLVGIAVGLALPELMTIDGVHVEAGGERAECPTMFHSVCRTVVWSCYWQIPGDIVLF